MSSGGSSIITGMRAGPFPQAVGMSATTINQSFCAVVDAKRPKILSIVANAGDTEESSLARRPLLGDRHCRRLHCVAVPLSVRTSLALEHTAGQTPVDLDLHVVYIHDIAEDFVFSHLCHCIAAVSATRGTSVCRRTGRRARFMLHLASCCTARCRRGLLEPC